MESDKVLPGVSNITVSVFFPSYPDQLRPLTLSPAVLWPNRCLAQGYPDVIAGKDFPTPRELEQNRPSTCSVRCNVL
jgi:hypothetical protein